MKRILLLTLFGIFALCGHARAISCSQSHIFVTGEVLTAAVLNANPANFVTCFSTIDNSNIGVNGIYASQIIPDTVGHATFGGSVVYQFNNGLVVNGSLTLNGSVLSPPWTIAQGGTNLTSLSGSKCIRSASAIAFGEAGGDCITTAGGQTIGGTLTITGLLTGAGITAGVGTVKGASDGSTTTYLPPGYAAGGTALASTFHIVQGNTNCTIGGATTYLCSVTPTFSGAASFASSSSYSCSGSVPAPVSGSTLNLWIAYSGTSPTFTLWGSSNNSGTNFQINYICVGT